MVGRAVQTTDGPGLVTKSSGKGWVVVETLKGGSYRMRLSQLWDYTLAPSSEANTPTSEGGSLSGSEAGEGSEASPSPGTAATPTGLVLQLPPSRAGDPSMPKNWSYSLLKKRVQTSHGVGIVESVIDKGWISVRLESGRKIKTRPGNVTELAADPETSSDFSAPDKFPHKKSRPNADEGDVDEIPSPQSIEGCDYRLDSLSRDAGGNGDFDDETAPPKSKRARVYVARRTINLEALASPFDQEKHFNEKSNQNAIKGLGEPPLGDEQPPGVPLSIGFSVQCSTQGNTW